MRQRTFRLFVSSTFQDFADERAILNERLLPLLQKHCERYGYGFEMVDLRWGIGDVASENQLTLDICLNEIIRCKRFAPRPHFLLMLGRRYGTIPLPTELDVEVFEAVIASSAEQERSLIQEWYEYDDNSREGSYRLRPRRGDYSRYSVWSGVKRRLLDILRAAKESDPTVSSKGPDIVSMTEHEFEAALLENDMADGAVVLLREESEDDPRARTLRERAGDLMRSKGLASQVINLRRDLPDYEQYFEEEVLSHVMRLVDLEVRSSEVDQAQDEGESPQTDPVFVGRENELDCLWEYVSSGSRSTLMVLGPSGSGKTTLLKRFANAYPHRKAFVSYGLSEGMYSIVGAIREIHRQLSGTDEESDYVSDSNLSETLWEDLSEGADETAPLLVVIDGLESLVGGSDVRENILPDILPSGAKLVVSYATQTNTPIVSPHGQPVLSIGPLSQTDALHIIDSRLALVGRRVVPTEQREALLNATCYGVTPLQATLISNIASRWTSNTKVMGLSETPEENALAYIEDAFRMLGHGRELVLFSMALICVAPFGIAEWELLEVLFTIVQVREEFTGQDRYGYVGDRLPFIVWSRLYYDLKECLETVLFKGVPVIRFVHGIFKEAVSLAFESYCDDARHALMSFYSSRPAHLDPGWHAPNTLRAANLPVLLDETGEREALARLLCSTDNLDAMVQIGDFEVALDMMARLVADTGATPADDIVAVSRYLQRHRRTLTCYPKSLPVTASLVLGTDRRRRLENAVLDASDGHMKAVPLPHPPTSGVALSTSGHKVAIWHGPWTYLYGLELTSGIRVFSRADSGDDMTRTAGREPPPAMRIWGEGLPGVR